MKNIIRILQVLLVIVSLNGCTKDYLDINKDPNSPTIPELNQLLSGSELYMVEALGQGDFIGDNLSSYVHQLVSREVQNYGMNAQANNPYNTWNYLYTYVLKDFDAIIKNAEPEGNLIYAGIAKTLKAYTFSIMVDLWGDIPFTEFNVEGLIAPKPDSSKDIYNALIAMLESGRSDLQNAEAVNTLRPGSDDFFYGGNKDKWIRLNNTITLKLLLQSRKAKSDITEWQEKFNALVSANNFIATGEDFQFWYKKDTSPRDMRHPAISNYSGQTTFYISPYFYETMNGDTYNTIDNPFANIQDPRIPYYFVNQLKSGQASESPHEYRNGNFMSIFFASNGPNSAGSNDKSLTKLGIYLNGGKYDDGKGGAVSVKDTYGEAPHKLITFSSLKFMLAELALAGETSGNARNLLKEGVEAAIAHVNLVAGKQAGTPTISNADRDAFINQILVRYDAADANGKMRIVMTQKWIANIFNPVDSYSDYRRTGFPKLFDPTKTQDPGNGVNPVEADRSPKRVPLTNIASFPRSLYYPTNSETELNPNMTQKTNLPTPFVFWDK
ncbi:MAG: SusD/RagB family nutrient-binding outer membrane lipoprotein [Porphyromonadaceae bacterium]|nr:SusD/RagB family nutrient-binding outer membrane lipoprotein [Porphyromonadaceae bacterium]